MKIINTDCQGWPVEALTLRELLQDIGFWEENVKLVMDINHPTLDLYPVRLIDDSQCYGVGDQFFTSVSTDNSSYLYLFTEKENKEAVKELNKDLEFIENLIKN